MAQTSADQTVGVQEEGSVPTVCKGKEEDWLAYQLSQRECKTEIRKTSRDSWRNFCSVINSLSDMLRHHNVLGGGLEDKTQCPLLDS